MEWSFAERAHRATWCRSQGSYITSKAACSWVPHTLDRGRIIPSLRPLRADARCVISAQARLSGKVKGKERKALLEKKAELEQRIAARATANTQPYR
jgi:starvation-inducible outer membrane lipoprotein